MKERFKSILESAITSFVGSANILERIAYKYETDKNNNIVKETNNSNTDFSSYHNRNVSMKQESSESNVSHMKTCSNSEHADNEDILNVHDMQRTIKSDNVELKAYFTFKSSHNETISAFPENDFRYNTLHETEAANSVYENPKQTSTFSS